MYKPLTESMRQSSNAMRSIAGTVLVTFCMLILQPAAMAAQSVMNEPSQQTHVPSNEEKLSKSVRSIEAKLGSMESKLGKAQDIVSDQADLATLRAELSQLDQTVSASFQDMEAHILSHNLPEIILQRHQNAVSQYQNEMNTLRQNLDAVDQATTNEERRLKLQQAKAHLSTKKHKRSQQPFDPNVLPNRSLTPDSNNKPKTDKNAFIRAGLHDTPYVNLAALGDFTFDKLSGASDPAYLAESDEVVLTPAIHAQAQALEYDPVQINRWVRNNIIWQPAWGAVKNAELTLSTKIGNAMDIASLTIALLRASKIPARYVHGTIDVPAEKFKNWAGGFTDINAAATHAASTGIPATGMISGGQISKIRMEHIWVEAAIDYNPSRGAKNSDADSWVQMDPSYKQYDYLAGLDAVAISGLNPEQLSTDFFNSGTVNEAESWMSGMTPSILQNAQTQTKGALQDHITNNLPNPTAGEVIGGRKMIVKAYPVLPSSLPNSIVVTGARYGKLPASLQQHMSYALGKDILGYPINPVSFPWSKLNNERITLSFKPATAADEETVQSLVPTGDITDISQLSGSVPSYLINVIPELKLNGQVIHSGTAMQLGEELEFVTTPKFAGQAAQPPRSYNVIAGSYLSVNVIAGSVSTQKLRDLQAKLDETRAILDTNDPAQTAALTNEDVFGNMFYAGTLSYYGQLIAMSRFIGQQQGGHSYLSAGYGTVGYEPNVSYFFGIPRTIEGGGLVFDIPIIGVATMNDGDLEKRKLFNLNTGLLASALEHATPEQMFASDPNNSQDAISAVKALSIANAEGQRTYHITQDNQATALPNIHHDPATMSEIRSSLASGKEVITHTDAVTIPGWSGAGYIIIDPVTGDGAYKIAGGQNGGYYLLVGLALGLISALALLFASPWLILLVGAVGFAITIFNLFTLDSEERLAFSGGRLIGLIAGLVLFSILGQFVFLAVSNFFLLTSLFLAISVLYGLLAEIIPTLMSDSRGTYRRKSNNSVYV